MKTFKNQAAQGDVLFTRIDELPTGLVEKEPELKGEHIITHSETGHHHVVSAPDVAVFAARVSPDEFRMFMVVKNTTTIRHNREFDQHEELQITPGIYQVDRQREQTAAGMRRALD